MRSDASIHPLVGLKSELCTRALPHHIRCEFGVIRFSILVSKQGEIRVQANHLSSYKAVLQAGSVKQSQDSNQMYFIYYVFLIKIRQANSIVLT